MGDKPISEKENVCFYCGGPTSSEPSWTPDRKAFCPANCFACALAMVATTFESVEAAWAWRERRRGK